MLARRASGRRGRRHRLYALALTWQHQPQEIVMQRTRAIRMTNHAHKSLDIAREPRFNVLAFGDPHAKPPCSNGNRLLNRFSNTSECGLMTQQYERATCAIT